MNEKIIRIENILQSEFNRDNFESLVRELLDNVDLENGGNFKKELSNYSSHIDESAYIGDYKDPDGKSVVIYAVKLKSVNFVENSRSTQRNYAKSIIDGNNYDAAIVAYFTDNDSKWRLSFVRLDYEIKFDSGKLNTEEKLTPARRYSFLVGQGEPCHTAIKQLAHFIENDNYNPTIDEIEDAFGVERVTKEFYKLYCEKYHQLQEHLVGNAEFIEEAERLGFDCDAFSVQFAKKLMGQIVFMYFLQKKGWLGVNVYPRELTEKEYKAVYYAKSPLKIQIQSVLPHIYQQCEDGIFRLNSGALRMLSEDLDVAIANCLPKKKNWGDGPQDFMRRLFNDAENREMNFFDKYLEPLFYDAMNRNRGEKGYFSTLHCRIPFLSGGLFEPIDGYDWKHTNFNIPNNIFSNVTDENVYGSDGILDIFDRYNFTISEDEPLEREVAIDPEMLGKVFENLLEVKDRKSKGAFYTPREIVHYMCQESLIEYLHKATQVPYNDIRNFVLYGDFMKDEDTVKSNGKYKTKMLIPESIFKCSSDGSRIVDRLSDIDKALAHVKIADPAVGSGAFPLGLLNEIVKIRQTITSYMSIGMSYFNKRNLYVKERSTYALKRNTIKDCIFAVDIDPSAVDITRLRLWLALVIDDIVVSDGDGIFELPNPTPLPNLDCNIICGNSLVDEFRGIPLINKAALNEEAQQNFGQEEYEYYLSEIVKTQDELYQCDDTQKKEKLKRVLSALRKKLIMQHLSNEGATTSIIKDICEAEKCITKPYVLWPIDFAKAFKDNGGFDIVIGNPPYGAKFTLKEKKVLARIFSQSNVPDYESADFFVEIAYQILNSTGALSYIIPNMFMANVYAEKYRIHLLNCWYLREIDNLSEIEVFDSAKVRNCIVFLSKLKDTNKSMFTKLTIKNSNINIIIKKFFEQVILKNNIANWLNLIDKDEKDIQITDKIKNASVTLGEIAEISQGLIPYDKYRGHTEEIIKNKIWNASYKKDDTYRKELKGRDVDRYKLNWNGKSWISYGNWLAAPRKPEFFKNERILIREITNPRILATYTNKEFYNTPSIINCINFTNDIYYILGIINSKLISFYHNIMSPKASKGLFPKILVSDVRNLPIKFVSSDVEVQLSKAVSNILNSDSSNFKDLEKEIDDIVYDIYEITPEEKEHIESWFSSRKK